MLASVRHSPSSGLLHIGFFSMPQKPSRGAELILVEHTLFPHPMPNAREHCETPRSQSPGHFSGRTPSAKPAAPSQRRSLFVFFEPRSSQGRCVPIVPCRHINQRYLLEKIFAIWLDIKNRHISGYRHKKRGAITKTVGHKVAFCEHHWAFPSR